MAVNIIDLLKIIHVKNHQRTAVRRQRLHHIPLDQRLNRAPVVEAGQRVLFRQLQQPLLFPLLLVDVRNQSDGPCRPLVLVRLKRVAHPAPDKAPILCGYPDLIFPVGGS